MDAQDLISVTIMSPHAVVWKGSALSLSAENSEGMFDIMPDHARFMTLIEKTHLIVYQKDGTERSFKLDTAVLFFENNAAQVYTHQSVE